MESPFLAIQRGFENLLANWPLLLIRVAENVVMIILIVVMVLGAVLPVVFFGFGRLLAEQFEAPEHAAEAFLTHPLLIIYLFFVILFAVLILIAVHSFVQGGVVGCYIEGDRNARRWSTADRGRFRAFTPELWFRYAKQSWWPVFLIYNLTWGIFGLLVLIPLTVLAVMIFLGRESPQIVFLACGGIALLFGLVVLGGFILHLWSTASIVMSVDRGGIVRALRSGWRIFVSRWLEFVVIALVGFMISLVALGSIGSASFAVGLIASVPGVGILTIPMQVAISFLQTMVSVAISAWFVAAAVAIVLR